MPAMEQPFVPFIYGRAVKPHEFLDRESELRTIFNRLRNGESTAIVGEPRIGKSSLLLKLADPDTQRAYLGDDAEGLVVALIDLHPISNDYTKTNFWEEALVPLQKRLGHTSTARFMKQAARSSYTRRPLERLLNHLDQRGWRLALLMDEFEQLLIHPHFQDPAFFALLRSLAKTGALVLVTASRWPVARMNGRLRGLLDIGSPAFNFMIDVHLRPFEETTVDTLLDRAADRLSPDDRRFIRRVAGRHPFLLQAMAATLVETAGNDRQVRAAEYFYERIDSHFDDLWYSLDDHSRTTAVVLSLVELGGRALGRNFDYSEIENVDAFGPQLRKLAELGLAQQVGEGWQLDWKHFLLWRGEQWAVGAQAFAWWVRDVAIAEARQVPTYTEWLAKKRYLSLLTQEQWDWLFDTVRSAPEWAIRGVGRLAQALFEELVRKE